MRITSCYLATIFIFASCNVFAVCDFMDKGRTIQCFSGGFLGLMGSPCTMLEITDKYKFVVLADAIFRSGSNYADNMEIHDLAIPPSRIVWEGALKFHAANRSVKHKGVGLLFCFASDKEKGPYKMVKCQDALKYGLPNKGNC